MLAPASAGLVLFQASLCWPSSPPTPARRQLLLYPNGNNRADAMALYLAVAEDDQAAFGLQRSASFKLILLSSVEGGDMVKETQHTFTTRETDWGEPPGAAPEDVRPARLCSPCSSGLGARWQVLQATVLARPRAAAQWLLQ